MGVRRDGHIHPAHDCQRRGVKSREKMTLGLKSMSPQPHQTALIVNNTYWSLKLMEDGSDMVPTNPIYDAGITSSFFRQKPKQLQKTTRGSRIGLLRRALQVKTAYIPYDVHSNYWAY